MSDILEPNVPTNDPDRLVKCLDVAHTAFQELADRAVAAGWGEAEVAAARF